MKKKNHFVLTLPRAVFIPKKTTYPKERRAAHIMIENQEFHGWSIVHAYLFKNIGKKDRVIQRDAWIENKTTVLDCKSMVFYPKDEFYKTVKKLSVYKYSFSEVMENLKKFRRYGRWS